MRPSPPPGGRTGVRAGHRLTTVHLSSRTKRRDRRCSRNWWLILPSTLTSTHCIGKRDFALAGVSSLLDPPDRAGSSFTTARPAILVWDMSLRGSPRLQAAAGRRAVLHDPIDDLAASSLRIDPAL